MTQLPETKNCILEFENEWLTIWFNRPEKRNSLSEGLLLEIRSVLELIKDDRKVRGIIFRGKGGVFCAGADLEGIKKIASSGEKTREMAVAMSKQAGSIFEAISKSPQITVSVVEGAAMAGAFGIACTTDLLVTMSDARYALTETKIGLTPAQIAPYVLNRLGFAQARKLLLLGTSFNGQKAFDLGMADYVADNEEELLHHIQVIKSKVKKCAPNAVAVTKGIIFSNNNIDLINAAELFSDSIVHEEGREGLASFFEKRKPSWAENK